MSNFELSIVYYCPCVLSLVKKEVAKRNFLSQVLLTDLLRARFNDAILIKIFPSIECIFITCLNDLYRCLCYDHEHCNHHSRKRNYFSYKTERFFSHKM